MKKRILFLMLNLFSPLSYALSSGSLKVLSPSMSDSSEGYLCEFDDSLRQVKVQLDRDSQMLAVETSQTTNYRGVSTRSRYLEDGIAWVTYYLKVEGRPYSHEFVLKFNESQGLIFFTLKMGAQEALCSGPSKGKRS